MQSKLKTQSWATSNNQNKNTSIVNCELFYPLAGSASKPGGLGQSLWSSGRTIALDVRLSQLRLTNLFLVLFLGQPRLRRWQDGFYERNIKPRSASSILQAFYYRFCLLHLRNPSKLVISKKWKSRID